MSAIKMTFKFLKEVCKANVIGKCVYADKMCNCHEDNCPILTFVETNNPESVERDKEKDDGKK